MLNFCTVLNIGYLAKGLALHQSLVNSKAKFHLYIFAFDDDTYQILSDKNIVDTTIFRLSIIESEALLKVKSSRSLAEYCWTCKPFILKHCLIEFNLNECTYVDGDLYFYNNPEILFTEMGNNSVLITPHNYYPLYDRSATSGIYCAQLVSFKNTPQGNYVLNWWAGACLKWCSSTYEDGKWADQKYLDSWPYMFDGVHICREVTAGLAPWNILNYTYSDRSEQITVNNKPLIFYHFHDLKYLSNNTWYLGGYGIPLYVVDNIYKPYIKTLLEINDAIKATYPEVDALNTIDFKKMDAFNTKYKMGIYVLDIKRSFKQFVTDAFFINRKKHYKSNYLRVN